MDNQHSHAQNERERIIKHIEFLSTFESDGEIEIHLSAASIADWHLAEVKRIVSIFEKALSKINAKDFIAERDCYVHVNYDDLQEALKYIKRANGGESLTPTGSEQ